MTDTRVTNTYKLCKKSDSMFMKILAALVWVFNKRFHQDYWTTIHETIYVPAVYSDDPDWGTARWKARHWEILEHEAIHVRQYQEEGILHDIKYLGPAVIPFVLLLLLIPFALFFPQTLFWPGMVLIGLTILTLPLSVGLAYWRWQKEFEACMPRMIRCLAYSDEALDREIDRWAHNLWWEYLFTWPPSWIRESFDKETRKALADSQG